MHRPQTSQYVNMILHSTNSLRHAVHPFDDAAEVSMKTRLPITLDERQSFFGGKDDVIVQAEKG